MTTSFDYIGRPGTVSAGLSFKGEEDEFVRCRQHSSGLYYIWSHRTRRYVTVDLGATGAEHGMLRASSSTVSKGELFSFGRDSVTGAITMRAQANGRYVSTELNGAGATFHMLRARASTVGGWERFEVSQSAANGDECAPFAFAPFNDHGLPAPLYVAADLGDAGAEHGMLRAQASSEGPDERFRLCHQEGTAYYYIQSLANRRYVTAELGYRGAGYGMLRARATAIGRWELFTIGHPPRSHGQISLRSAANGRYVSVEWSDTGAHARELRARATTAGSWEQFSAYTPPTLPVAHLKAVVSGTTVTLSWTNPADSNLTAIVINRADGPYPVREPADGEPLSAQGIMSSYTDSGLSPTSTYSWTVWAVDDAGQFSAPMSVSSSG